MQQETKTATDKYKEYKAYAESLDDKVLRNKVTANEADILKQSKFAEATKDLNQELLKGIKYNTDYAESENLLSKNAQSMSGAFSGIKGKLSSLGSSLKNIAAGIGNMVMIQIAMSAISWAFGELDNYTHRAENNLSDLEKIATEINDKKDAYTSHSTSVNKIKNEYYELADGVNSYGENISLTSTQYGRYIELSNEIAQMYPNLVKGYSAQNDAILECKNNVEALNKAMADEKNAYYETIVSKEQDSFGKALENIWTNQGRWGADDETYITQIKALDQFVRNLNKKKDTQLTPALSKALKGAGVEDLVKTGGGTEYGMSYLYNEINEKDLSTIISAVKNQQSVLKRQINDLVNNSFKPVLDAYIHYTNEQFSTLDSKSQALIEQYINSATWDNFYSKIIDPEASTADNLETVKQTVSGIIKAFNNPELADTLSSVQSKIDDIKNGKIDVSNYQDLSNQIKKVLSSVDGIDTVTKALFVKLLFSDVEVADNVNIDDAIANLVNRATKQTHNTKSATKNAPTINGIIPVTIPVELGGVDTNSFVHSIKEQFADGTGLEEIQQEAANLGVNPLQTVFGNIDTNNREVLEWTDSNLEKYKTAIESWGSTVEDMKGTISTVFAGSDTFDGVEIAFSPMLQTPDGAVLLDADTVYEYIWSLIDEAGEGWTNEDLLKLDTKGIEIDGVKIKNLIADIGDTADHTAKTMHYLGTNGAISLAQKEIQGFNEWIDGLSDDDKQIVYQISCDTDTADFTLSEWQDKVKEYTQKNTDLIDKVSKEEKDKTKEYLQSLDFNTISKLYNKKDNISSLEDIKKAVKDIKKEAEDKVTFKVSTEDATKKVTSVLSAFKAVKTAINEYNENGKLSFDTLEAVLSLDDSYINLLVNEQGELDLTSEKFRDLAKAQLERLKASYLQEAIDEVGKLKNETQALAYLQKSQDSAAKSATNLADKKWKEAYATAAAKDAEQGTGTLYQQTVIQAESAWRKKAALIDSYASSLGDLSTSTDEATSASEKYKKQIEKEEKALEKSKDALEKKKEALEDTKSGYEDALSAIESLVDWTEKYIKQTKQDEIDALQERKDKIDELIEKKQELLDKEKEEADFNKQLKEKENAVASNALSAAITGLDDSSAGKKAHKENVDDLVESREDLYDYLSDYQYDTRKEALDKLKEETDKHYDDEIQTIQDFLNNEVSLHRAACNMIDNDNGTLYNNLLWYCQNYTTTTEAEFNHMWQSAQSALYEYGTAQLNVMDLMNTLQSRIYDVDSTIANVTGSIDNYTSRIDSLKQKIDELGNSAQTTKAKIDSVKIQPSSITGHGYKITYNGKVYKTNLTNKEDAETYFISRISKDWYGGRALPAGSLWSKMKAYASGTKSAKGGLSIVDEEGIGSELIPTSLGNGRYTILPQGNPVFSKAMTNELFEFASAPTDYFAQKFGSEITPNVVNNKSTVVSPAININVQGDATQATVNALHKESERIMDNTIKKLMSYTVNNRYL